MSVAGTFNGWNSSSNPLILESVTSGVWSVDVAAARTNDSYKYVVNGSLWRTDPRGRVVSSANNNSVVTSTNGFNWTGDSASITNALNLMATNYAGVWNIAEDTKEIGGFNYYWDFTFN